MEQHLESQHPGHLTEVIDAIKACQFVAFLGADINLCGRGEGDDREPASWRSGGFPPSNQELAVFLDELSNRSYSNLIKCPLSEARDLVALPEGCPVRNGTITRMELQHVAQYIVDLREGEGSGLVRKTMSAISQGPLLTNPVHKFLAELTGQMRRKGIYPPYPLFVTSCFDRSLEKAFDECEEKYHLVSHVGPKAALVDTSLIDTSGRLQLTDHSTSREGKRKVQYFFEHRRPGDVKAHPILGSLANKYLGLARDDHPVILKIYEGYPEYAITEDHYIDYLAGVGIHELLPAELLATLDLESSYILFLGYSPSFWNLRVILHRLWSDNVLKQKPNRWSAVQANLNEIDKALWKSIGNPPVGVSSLEDYIAVLRKRLRQIPAVKRRHTGGGPHSTKRSQVFVSYSHVDKEWLMRLKKILAPAIREENIPIWDDTNIQPGDKWKDEIQSALNSAKVAVLLVSEDFLASPFITKAEFPTILKMAEQRGLKILWILLRSCLYKSSPLKSYEAAHKPLIPLDKMNPSEQNEVLVEICQKIVDIYQAGRD